MRLYHASAVIVERPDVYHSREHLDFGRGFYLTVLRHQAEKYARRFLFRSGKAYINEYILTSFRDSRGKSLTNTMRDGWTLLAIAAKGFDSKHLILWKEALPMTRYSTP